MLPNFKLFYETVVIRKRRNLKKKNENQMHRMTEQNRTEQKA